MKTFVKSLTFAALTAGFLSACDTDPCKDVVCSSNATCVEGTCVCNTGYEKSGDSCVLVREKFLGTYTVVLDSSAGTGDLAGNGYQVTIHAVGVPASNLLEVRISNMSNTFKTNPTIATVSGDSIFIASQHPDQDPYEIYGSGVRTATGMNWVYNVNNGTASNNHTYTSIWIKQ